MTRADELREQLNQLEASIGRLGYGMGRDALAIPSRFDAVNSGLVSFQAAGQAMRAEAARLETVSAQFRRKAQAFLREIGGAKALEDARRAHQPDPDHWWWFLDRLEAERRRARLRRLLWLAAGLVAVLLLLFALYQRFLAPDPATRERLIREQAAENLALSGDLAAALSEIERALAVAPDDPQLLVFKGALQQVMGQEDQAKAVFVRAEGAFESRQPFLLTRSQTYLLLGQAEAALKDAQAVVELDPDSAAGYMMLGRSHQQLENYLDAVFAYEQASALAEAAGDYQLAATARVNMGVLIQQLQAPPSGGN